MLALDSWLPQCADLRMGQSARVKHDCGPDNVMKVSRTPKGLSAWCFRCNDKGWAPPEPEPLADRLARLSALSQADSYCAPDLPTPCVYDWGLWPDRARFWLIKAGLTRHDAGVMRGYYHPPTDRVVLPVFGALPGPCGDRAEVVFWQARALDGRQPKYLSPNVPKNRVLPRWGSAEDVTLTEDLLSAYKVGLVGEAWCLMGTRMTDYCLTELVKRQARVNVWLDPDAAGLSGAAKTLHKLRAAGLEARRIDSERDPKLVHRSQIKELLNGYNLG